MKKIFIFLGLMFVMLSGTYAQKDRQAIGFGLSYGTEIESAGLGIKYRYCPKFCVNGNRIQL
jgi:outer membrane protein X